MITFDGESLPEGLMQEIISCGYISDALLRTRSLAEVSDSVVEQYAAYAGDDEQRGKLGAITEVTKPSDLTDVAVAMAIMAGSRYYAQRLDELERAAARYARRHGVTVKRLARHVELTERAATTRYTLRPRLGDDQQQTRGKQG